MGVIFFLIGVSLSVALLFLLAFYFALKSGQFDDQVTPSMRMLFDSEIKKSSKK